MHVIQVGFNMNSIYDKYEDKIVRMGRNLITLAEKNQIFPKDDEMWNAAVTAGNKLVTLGTTWTSFKSFDDLNDKETEAVYTYLDEYGIEHPSIPIEDLV